MKKTYGWIIGIAASPFVLFLLLTLLLYCPPVQRWAVDIATQFASEETGMKISIDEVRLRFPLDLQLGGVKAIQPCDTMPQVKDTLINADRIICDVQLCPLLFNSNVQVDMMQMEGVRLNTATMISDCRVKGRVGRLMLTSHGIDLKRDTLLLNKAILADATLDICLADTAKEDTTKTETYWKIKIHNLDIQRTNLMLHLPGDTLRIAADIQQLTARGGDINLEEGIYKVDAIDLNNSRVRYDNRFEPKVKGMDFNHMEVSELNVGIDSIYIRQPDVCLKIRACNAKEKSGLRLATLTGVVSLDSTTIHVQDFDLQTANNDMVPYTRLQGSVNMDMNTFSANNPGTMTASIDGQIGKRDLMIIVGSSLPEELVRLWPDAPAALHGTMHGNMKKCTLQAITLNIPTLAKATLSGEARNLDDTRRTTVDARIDLVAANGNGTAHGRASLAMRNMSYSAAMDFNSLNLNRFIPGKGLGRFTGSLRAKGCGTDPLSHSTQLMADAKIRSFRYDDYDLAGATVTASLRGGVAHAELKTVADIMLANITLDGTINRKILNASIKATVENIDFYALHMTKRPLALAVNGDIEVSTDLRNSHALRGRIGNICITDTTRQFTPNDIVMDIFTRSDSTHAEVVCGDFNANVSMNSGYKKLMSLTDDLTKEIKRQAEARIIDEMALRNMFPTGSLRLSSGKDNPLARMITTLGFSFSTIDTDVNISRQMGINGYVRIDTLQYGGNRFDDIDLQLTSDESRLGYALRIVNGKHNPNFSFAASISGEVQHNGTTLSLQFEDAKNRKGVDVDLMAVMEDDYIRISITNDTPLLGYAPFDVNPDNYIRLSRDMRVLADVSLRSPNGMGIQIYTEDENVRALQDITVSINNLDLTAVTQALPFMPNLGGRLDGDFHLIMEEDQMSISTDSDLHAFSYEGSPMGDISTQLVYIPRDDGSHYVDGVLFKGGEEVATIKGTYYFEGADMIDAELELTQMPMDLINGFIPQQVVGMAGTGTGHLEVKGYVANPIINGSIDLSKARLISVPYGVSLAMDTKQVDIVNSSVIFEDYRLTASNGSPLLVSGYFDFSSLSAMMTNLHVTGQNVQIINAKETRKSEAYGKAFVNFYGTITGLLDKLQIKAQLDLLPSTNLYYILRDSPITTDNRLKELVTFTDFSDTSKPVTGLPPVDGIVMDLNIDVREGSHVVCWLDNNHTNYLDIYGEGELNFRYAQDKMKMTGRYTLSQGEMKYSLPVIPLKTFTITPESYIEFKGDMMNPTLNIEATEHNRANAAVDGQNVMVDFVCGVVLTKTLQDMGLEFIIRAPENPSIDEQLNVMSKEERGKLAVGMLTTGMFLDEKASNITMNSALSSFLQQEINNIAGSALKTIDLTIGLENNMTPDGNMRMDYSFKFAKRFWNNRVSVAIGGKISTGAQTAGKTPSFFDNVEVQYRLSETSNRYLQLFYKHDVYDYLEGYLDHFGVGYLWKRRFQHFTDLFGKRRQVPQAGSEQDTLVGKDTTAIVIPDTIR